MKRASELFFKGKVAVVTGSSMGIGKAIAIELGKAGASVVINGRDFTKLENCTAELTSMGFTVMPVRADITDYTECQFLINETLRRFGRIDFLVNNAGIVGYSTFESFDPSHYRIALDSNIYSAVYPTMAALPHIKQTGGSVIFISSLAGLMGLPNYSAYSAGKMALTALSQSLRSELRNSGVHIGIVFVSFTRNEESKKFISADGTLVPVPPRKSWTQQPREKVAVSIVRLIRKRKSTVTLSLIGKAYRFLIWLMPGVANKILRKVSK